MTTTRQAAPRATDADIGWATFASVMLGLVGALNILDGIVAVSKSSFYVADARYVFSDLKTWGWIVLAVGIGQVAAAYYVLKGSETARWFGIGAAGVNLIVQLMFAQAYPFWALIAIGLDVLVIYGLTAHAGVRLRGQL
jgi:hypothetical protein